MASRCFISAAALLLTIYGSQALADPKSATYTCSFGRYGNIAIDTREPGSTIAVGGKSYPSRSGSYFYQTDDGKVALFSPDMKRWTYVDPQSDPRMKGVVGRHCSRKANRL